MMERIMFICTYNGVRRHTSPVSTSMKTYVQQWFGGHVGITSNLIKNVAKPAITTTILTYQRMPAQFYLSAGNH